MAQSRVVLEEHPLSSFFRELPTTVLSFMQLAHQLQQTQIDRDYKASREDLSFARKEYLQAQAREDAWRDTIAKTGYSTKHITSPGEDLMEATTSDILSATSDTKDRVSQLQELSSDLKRWSDKGKDWEKDFASYAEADKEEAWKDYLLEGDVKLDEKGNVVGTGEFAEALKSLNAVELEKLKGVNYRQAIMSNLRDESEAIKMFGQAATGTVALSKISQSGKISAVKDQIRTALSYSGIAGIKSIESDAFEHPGDYKSGDGKKKLADIEDQKLIIGREYEYLMEGQYMPGTEDSQERWGFIYDTMVDDFTVAMPQYQTGDYGSTPGNQKRLNETVSHVYLTYQKKLESDPEGANTYAAKALTYLGVDLTNADQLNKLGITENLENIAYDKQISSVLDNLDDTPLITALDTLNAEQDAQQTYIDSLESTKEVVPQVTDVAPTADFQEYQWGLFDDPRGIKHLKPQTTGAGVFQYGSEGEEPLIRSATPGSVLPVFNPIGFFGQEGKRQPAEPGSYSPRDYDPTISIPQDMSLPQSDALSVSLDAVSEQNTRRARMYDLVLSEGSSEAVAEKTLPDNSREEYLADVYLASNAMKGQGITFAEIIQAYRDDGLPDPGDWLIEMFPEIEAELIR